MDKLVPDALLNIFTSNDCSKPLYVQNIQMRHLDEANRIRLLLSDGKWSINSVFKPSEKQEKIEGIEKYDYLLITDFTISGSTSNNKYFLLIHKCEIISKGQKPSYEFSSVDNYLKQHPELNNYEKSVEIVLNNNNNNNHSNNDIQSKSNDTNNNNAYRNTSSNTNININNQSNQVETVPKVEKQSQKIQKSSSNNNIQTIDSISPYITNWTIKARISYKGDIRTWKKPGSEGKLFSFNLLDETGEIKATCFNDVADKFYDLIQENNVYKISKGSLKTANARFNNLGHPYEMSIEKDTMIEPINDDTDVPKVQFNFVQLNDIENLENNQVIDVLGIVKNVEECKEITSKSTGKHYDRRDITIVDQSQTAITVGLWNKSARDFNYDNGTPIAIKGCKINEFRGKQLSLLQSAMIIPNPDLPEAYKLKGWYDNEGSTETFKRLDSSTSKPSNLNSVESIKERISILNVHESKLGFNEKPDYFTIKASISYMKPDNFSYPACSSEGCSKKVIEQSDGTWRCEKCSINHPEPDHRYIVTISGIDETGQIWLNLFNEEATQLLGCSAKTLLEMKESTDPTLLKNYLSNTIMFNEYSFRCRARLDSYQGVDKARFQVLGLSKVDPSIESDVLIDLINKLDI